MIIQAVLAFILLMLIAQVISAPLVSRILKSAAALIFATGLVLVFDPDLSNSIAHRFGVGRGADLVFYLAVSCGAVILFRLYLRVRTLELRQVALIRQAAIQQYYLDAQRQAPTSTE